MVISQSCHAGASVYYSSDHLFPLGSYFNCFGNETSLSSCQSLTSSSCDSNNAAGVHCRGDVITGTCKTIVQGHQDMKRIGDCGLSSQYFIVHYYD